MGKFPLGDAVSTGNWEILIPRSPFSPESLSETLLGGQAFRWRPGAEPCSWMGLWAENAVSLKLEAAGQLLAWRHTRKTSLQEIRDYLGIEKTRELITFLPLNADPVLQDLFVRWGTLSLLCQPPGETLLAFICSSNKQILQIRVMIERLAETFGAPLPGTAQFALPGWDRLAEVSEKELKGCSLGYRARHVTGCAAYLKRHPGYLSQIPKMDYAEARETLMRLPGVGPKVADCVLLFGYGRAQSFPVDTWIARLLVERYPELSGWSREQLATFFRIHYGKAAGLAQQWLFAEKQPGRTNRQKSMDNPG